MTSSSLSPLTKAAGPTWVYCTVCVRFQGRWWTYYTWRVVQSPNVSYNALIMTFWEWAEITTGIIVSCLPVISNSSYTSLPNPTRLCPHPPPNHPAPSLRRRQHLRMPKVGYKSRFSSTDVPSLMDTIITVGTGA